MGAVRAALEERSLPPAFYSAPLLLRSAVSLSSAAFQERPEQNSATVQITEASLVFLPSQIVLQHF